MNKVEAKFQILFKHWLQVHWTGGSAAFELKRTLKDSFYIPNLATHQKTALTQASTGMLYHKISDSGIGQKPFDAFVLKASEAYVVIAFGEKLRDFYLIPIDVWNKKIINQTSIKKEDVSKWKDVMYVAI